MLTTEAAIYVANIRTVKYTVPGILEAVGIEWPPNSCSSPSGLDFHDHGRSYGYTEVQEGELEEILPDGTVRTYRAGDHFTETPETVHMVRSLKGAKSSHVYSPPITGTMTLHRL
jgi:hypothetical protein